MGSIQVYHLMWGSVSLYLPSETCIYIFHTLSLSYLVGRTMMVGHIPVVCTHSLMSTNHIDMTAHIPAFLSKLGTTHIYMDHSTAWQSLISHLWSNASRTVTHQCISMANDCLTSVIKHKTFAPCHVSPHCKIHH